MDETFRLRRYYRNLGAGGLLGFPAWLAFGVIVSLTDPEVSHRLVAVALMGGIPLVMAGLSLWLLLAFWRVELTIREEFIKVRGIVRSKEIGLLEVIEARWRLRPLGGSLVLRSESARLTIEFANYNDEDRDRIVRHLRSVLRPEVQSGWNLFAYKLRYLEPRSVCLKPGPDEILVRRNHWDRYFWPALAVATLAGIISWKGTGESRFLLAPLPALVGWALIRFSTPADGMVVQKLSSSANPELAHFLWFALIWGLVAVAGLIAHGVFRPRLTHPDADLIVGAVIWFGALLFECGLQDRRRSRRDREAADLAAKESGEAGFDPWLTD